MAAPGTVFLMYHELELPGRCLILSEPGYVRYVLHETTFRGQIGWLHENGWRGLNVSEALRPATEKSIEKSVVITFDDGCETDLLAAAPILQEAGFHATFYVTAGFAGKPGYMSAGQLQELNSTGFEIGCHSMTHAYLNDLDPQQLRIEIADARARLEDMSGGRVEHFSCPGGRYDERVLILARQSGYRSVATSYARANGPTTDPFCLGRVAILRNTSQTAFQQICSGESLLKIRWSDSVRDSTRKVLGNSLYDRVRTAMLRRS